MHSEVPPFLTFEPLFKERLWGGRRLETVFGKKLPPGEQIGESWEIVDRPEAQSIVRQGPWRGRMLHELWREHRAEIFGEDMPDAPVLANDAIAEIVTHPGARITVQGSLHPSSVLRVNVTQVARQGVRSIALLDPDDFT